jgi:predicted Zn-dependent protease
MDGAGRLREIKERLQGAREHYDAAAAEFNQLLGEIPSNIPYPDSTVRIHLAASEYRRALQELEDASADLANFELGRKPNAE